MMVSTKGRYALRLMVDLALHDNGKFIALKDYTVGEILRAIEGSFAPISCLEDEENQCENYDTCATIEFWEGLYKVVNEYLDGTTLYDLVEIQKEKMGGNYYI